MASDVDLLRQAAKKIRDGEEYEDGEGRFVPVMDPGLVEPLASWLDQDAADWDEALGEYDPGSRYHSPALKRAWRLGLAAVHAPAVAVARVICGEDS